MKITLFVFRPQVTGQAEGVGAYARKGQIHSGPAQCRRRGVHLAEHEQHEADPVRGHLSSVHMYPVGISCTLHVQQNSWLISF